MKQSETATDDESDNDERTLDLNDYPDGTGTMLGTIHLHGPWDVGDGMPRREVKHTTDLSKSQVRVRAEKLLEDDFLIEERVDVGQSHPEARYRLTGAAREVAAGCAESVRMFDEVPTEPGQDEFLEVLSHVSRLRRDDGVEEEARSLDALVNRVSAVEDRLDHAEDDREVLHDRTDKSLEWMITLARAVTDALDDVIVDRCSQCGEFAVLTDDGMRSPLCDDCRL